MTNFSFGPLLLDRGVRFRLWAPQQDTVRLRCDNGEPVVMNLGANGWHVFDAADARPGTRYCFILEDGTEVPDPASRHQPQDVHGPSEVIDGDFDWRVTDWSGRPWHEMVIYELHVGAFTELGTFLSVIPKLDYLKSMGITAIQLMPIADFPGRRGWGYDGVLPYAPESTYGRPEDLKALIDAAHQRGISVFLDVVYNHFGPDGNYLPSYAPIFTDRHETPWGQGVNYDGESSRFVRDFVIENAIYWITEFQIDGLRLDAVHAIKDDSREHLLMELASRARAAAGSRKLHLIVENEENDSALLSGGHDDRQRPYTAQWNDDIHHVLHTAMTGEDFGYYADYAGDGEKLGRSLAEGFVFQGEHMPYRGSPRGRPSGGLPPTAFISFIQNHDQIGNRARGDRLSETAPPLALRAAAALYLLAPQIPMVFMGEEWASRQPFPFFCDFHDELNAIVREGRKKELSRLPGFDDDSQGAVPDPTDEKTFLSAKLDWKQAESTEQAALCEFYRHLIALRHAEIVPRLAAIGGNTGRYIICDGVVHVTWSLCDGSKLKLVANLSGDSRFGRFALDGRTLLVEGYLTDQEIGPWTIGWAMEDAASSGI